MGGKKWSENTIASSSAPEWVEKGRAATYSCIRLFHSLISVCENAQIYLHRALMPDLHVWVRPAREDGIIQELKLSIAAAVSESCRCYSYWLYWPWSCTYHAFIIPIRLHMCIILLILFHELSMTLKLIVFMWTEDIFCFLSPTQNSYFTKRLNSHRISSSYCQSCNLIFQRNKQAPCSENLF